MTAASRIDHWEDGRPKTYLDCPQCLRDWGMGLALRGTEGLAVECRTCGFRGPAFVGPVGAEKDAKVIAAWNHLPRKAAIEWTPEKRRARGL